MSNNEGLTTECPSVVGPLALRVEDAAPSNVRIAHYPDGSKRIQGAYRWREGYNGGLTWKDLPMVKVDDLGQAVLARV